MFFRHDFYAGLYRSYAGMKCRHCITVGFGRWIGESIAIAARVETCTKEDH